MEIRSLQDTSLSEIVNCLNRAFSNYFVQLPTAVGYWKERFKAARVDLTASYGIFDNGQLVAFVVHGLDLHHGQFTAFNSGTGVLPEYRGKAAIDRIYEYALPQLRERGVEKCMLEVIQENSKAVRVYERIGYNVKRRLHCYRGQIKYQASQLNCREVAFQEILPLQRQEHLYSWDNSNDAVLSSGEIYKTYLVSTPSGEKSGYFTMNPEAGYLAQLESFSGAHIPLLNVVARHGNQVRINNIDETRSDLMYDLRECGLRNNLDQYEMEMQL